MEGLPNCIIIGVPKAGTTSLRQYLIDHPSISGAIKKETFFWNRNNSIEAPDLESYRALFEEAKTPLIVDNTPRYFHDLAGSCSALKKHLGQDLKIVLILREPKSRVFSFYKFKKRRLEIEENVDFDSYVSACLKASESDKRESQELLAAVDEGAYYESLKMWEEEYMDNLHVLFFDQLKDDPKGCLQSLVSRLDLDPNFYNDYDFKKENQSVGFKNKGLHRLGMSIYKTFESILLKNKALRQGITNLYYLINGKSVNEKMSSETVERLDKFYAAANADLLKIDAINNADYRPTWLQQ